MFLHKVFRNISGANKTIISTSKRVSLCIFLTCIASFLLYSQNHVIQSEMMEEREDFEEWSLPLNRINELRRFHHDTICKKDAFHEYKEFHSHALKRQSSKYLVYHILDEDMVGLGCRITAALYALSLAVATKRVLIISGEEFKHLYSSQINFADEELVRRIAQITQNITIGDCIMKDGKTYAKFDIVQSNIEQVHDMFFGSTFASIDTLYTNNIGSHRHLDNAMVLDEDFRHRILDIFGYSYKDFSTGLTALLRHDHYLMVPVYPMIWRLFWGCAHWFLLDSMSESLRHEIISPFAGRLRSCEKYVAIHFRGGDTNFKQTLISNKNSEQAIKRNFVDRQMIGRWSNRIRTPDKAMELFIYRAKKLIASWPDTRVCVFVASDSTKFHSEVVKTFGNLTMQTSGIPQHSSLSRSKNSILKALADYILIGSADGVVHGMSTLSESALERNYAAGAKEIKCRSPQKKLWSNFKTWYCLHNGEVPDLRTRNTITYLKLRYPEKLENSRHAYTRRTYKLPLCR